MQKILEELLYELETMHLVVELVPNRDGVGNVRIATSHNPEWYRVLCAQYLSTRKRKNEAIDTKIKRRNILRALQNMSAGLSGGKYESDLIRICEERLWEQDRQRYDEDW